MKIEERWKAHTEARIAERQAAYDYGVWNVDSVEGPRCKRALAAATRNADKTARAYGQAVLQEAEVLEQYTCHVACDHGDECRTTRRAALRARIAALGGKDAL